jgi:cell division protease FtsH
MMGGRAAEELMFNEVTTGASNDIEKATSIARQMVIEYGMSDLGPVNLGPQADGRMYEAVQVSPDMLAKIDTEVKRILDTAYKLAFATLKKAKAKLDDVAGELIKKETIEGDEFDRLMGSTRVAFAPVPSA